MPLRQAKVRQAVLLELAYLSVFTHRLLHARSVVHGQFIIMLSVFSCPGAVPPVGKRIYSESVARMCDAYRQKAAGRIVASIRIRNEDRISWFILC